MFVTVSGLVYAQILSSPGIFALHFNAFGALSAFATLLNVVLVVLILRTRSHTDDIQWFLLYILALFVFGVSQTLQAFSVYPGGALFWEHLGGVGIVTMPAALFLFIKYYTRAINDIATWITPLMGICWGILSFFYATAVIIPATYGYKFQWGYYSIVTPEPGYAIGVIWFGSMMLLSLALLIKFYFTATNPILRKQALLYMLSISFPAIVALFMDGILPAYGIGYSIPPLGLMFTTASVIVIYYGITRYQLFRLNPQLLAENVLSTMEEGIIVTGKDMHIETVNPQAEKILGQSGHQIQKNRIMDYFSVESWAKIYASIKGKSVEYEIGEIAIIGPGGRSIPVRVSGSKLQENSKLLGYVFAISDITELQESYEALEKEKLSVEHKVEVRTKKLREAQERLAETDKIKTEFVTLTSHNLRTPLTIIKGNLEFMTQSRLDNDQKKFVSNLETSTKRLGDLVEELLTISRIEAGDQSTLEQTSLQNVLEPLIEEAQRLGVASHNEFSFEVPNHTVLLQANVGRLQSAILNLLDNAFKFTTKGTVKLLASADHEHITLQVIDSGIGISEAEKPKLYTKFHRSGGEGEYDYNYAGEGIGLYFTKLILIEHGGHIDVKSRLGHGTTFTVTLPRHKKAA